MSIRVFKQVESGERYVGSREKKLSLGYKETKEAESGGVFKIMYVSIRMFKKRLIGIIGSEE